MEEMQYNVRRRLLYGNRVIKEAEGVDLMRPILLWAAADPHKGIERTGTGYGR